jgi:hypothetical protein
MLSNENEILGTGHGLKNRVTACRKRIRFNRFHRTQIVNQPKERLPESVSGAANVPGYITDGASIRGVLVRVLDGEASQLGAEQEVGKT